MQTTPSLVVAGFRDARKGSECDYRGPARDLCGNEAVLDLDCSGDMNAHM